MIRTWSLAPARRATKQYRGSHCVVGCKGWTPWVLVCSLGTENLFAGVPLKSQWGLGFWIGRGNCSGFRCKFSIIHPSRGLRSAVLVFEAASWRGVLLEWRRHIHELFRSCTALNSTEKLCILAAVRSTSNSGTRTVLRAHTHPRPQNPSSTPS